MKNIFIGMLSATALAASTIAMAGGPDNMATPAPAVVAPASSNFMSVLNGVYLGTDLGYAITPNEFSSSLPGLTDDGFTFAFHAGYNFNQYVAFEAGYTRLPKAGYNSPVGFAGTDNNDVYSFVVKGIYPVMNQLNVFAKAGYALSNSDLVVAGINTTNFVGKVYSNPTVAGGVEYRVMPHVGVNVQYTAIIGVNGEAATSDLATAGLNYYF